MSHITPPDGNVFSDLGFAPGEARNLLLRSKLMVVAKRFIEARGLTQTEAAGVMGTSQPRISELVRGKIDQFTIDSLVNMLATAGVEVDIALPDGAALEA